MSSQIRLVGEGLATLRTLERLLPGVCTNVALQQPGSAETLAAVRTRATCKSGDGSYLKKMTSPPKGVGRNGNFRGSQNQKSGKCHELSRKSIQFVFTHPTRGGFGGGGSKFQKSGKFHELSRKSIKKKIYPPPPPPHHHRGSQWEF